MKPTSEILERIEKCSSEHKDGVFTRLYRYLLREDITIWLVIITRWTTSAILWSTVA